MSLSYNILIFNTESNSMPNVRSRILNIAEGYSLDNTSMNFEEISTKHKEYDSFAISSYNNFLIVSDEKNCITKKLLESSIEFTSILRTEIQSTVDVELIEYWKKDELIRKYSLGLESHMDELNKLRGEIPEEVFSQMIKEGKEKGHPQWFENNGKSTFSVLDAYGIKESIIIDHVSWDLYVKGFLYTEPPLSTE